MLRLSIDPPPSMNDIWRMSGGQRCPDPRPLKNTGVGPGDISETRLRRWVTSWFPDSSRCAQITVLSTSLAVALSIWPVGPALYLLHFSKNAAYAQPPLVLRLLCLPHPPGAHPPGPRLGLGPCIACVRHCFTLSCEAACLHASPRGDVTHRRPHTLSLVICLAFFTALETVYSAIYNAVI